MIRLSGSGVAGAPQPLQWQPAAADSVNKLFIKQTSSLSFIAIWRQIGSSRNFHVRMRTTLVQSSWQTCIMYINFDDLYNSRIVGIILLSLTKHDSTRSTSTSSTAPSSDKARRRMVLTIHTKRCQVSLTLCQSSITIIAKTWTVFLSKLCTNKNEYFQIWDPYLISILSQREHRVSTTEPSPQITDPIIFPNCNYG